MRQWQFVSRDERYSFPNSFSSSRHHYDTCSGYLRCQERNPSNPQIKRSLGQANVANSQVCKACRSATMLKHLLVFFNKSSLNMREGKCVLLNYFMFVAFFEVATRNLKWLRSAIIHAWGHCHDCSTIRILIWQNWSHLFSPLCHPCQLDKDLFIVRQWWAYMARLPQALRKGVATWFA